MSAINLETAMLWVRLLLGVSVLIGCMEELVRLHNYSPAGLFSWDVFSTQYPEANSPVLRPLLNSILGYRGVQILLYCELVAILLMLVPHQSSLFQAITIAMVLAVKLALAYRCGYGSDGSDQMETLVLIGLLASLCLSASSVASLGIWFIALQSCLAYGASGVSKLFSPAWMNGSAAFKIFNTYTYGNTWVATFFHKVPLASKPSCWLIVSYECLFPICLLTPTPIMWTILGLGILFHIFNAFVMGLNKFFWAFISTYPAIIYCHYVLSH